MRKDRSHLVCPESIEANLCQARGGYVGGFRWRTVFTSCRRTVAHCLHCLKCTGTIHHSAQINPFVELW